MRFACRSWIFAVARVIAVWLTKAQTLLTLGYFLMLGRALLKTLN
jgi:hypothetical protein